METTEFTACDMYCKAWLPDNKNPDSVLQIVHGLGEMSEYYEQLGEFMAGKNIAVYLSELRCHGRTALPADTEDVCQDMIADAIGFTEYITARHGMIPVLLGHSMGATLAQLMMIEREYHKVILTGCANFRDIDRLISILDKEIAVKGKSSPSIEAFTEMFGKVAERFPEKCTVSWVTSDLERAEYYEKLPYTNKMYSCGFYRSFLKAQKTVQGDIMPWDYLYHPKLYIACGKNDSVGEYGEYPPRLAEKYRKSGFEVKLSVYDGMRHSVLQECDRTGVYSDISQFILTE